MLKGMKRSFRYRFLTYLLLESGFDPLEPLSVLFDEPPSEFLADFPAPSFDLELPESPDDASDLAAFVYASLR